MNGLDELLRRLAREDAVLVRVEAAEGSVPREVGAWMAVWAAGETGTIGGGHLEWEAIAQARARLPGPAGARPAAWRQRFALGPALGQCCGGVVHLGFEPVGAADAARLARVLQAHHHPVALFGGGHVGRALVRAMAPLPLSITWIDSRDEIFPADAPATVRCEHSDPVHQAVADLAPGTRVLIMSFSHAEDLDIVAECLRRSRAQDDLPYIGLIGSRTKWATFRHRLEARGISADELARVTCPIGVPGITGKQPEVVAIAVAAQILQSVSASA